jgi:hypothetical protein
MRGIRTGAVVQNVFTFAKTAALLGLVAIGFLTGAQPGGARAQFRPFLGRRRLEHAQVLAFARESAAGA